MPEPPQIPGTDPVTPPTRAQARAQSANAVPPAHAAPASAPVLDDGTYPVLRTPTARGALALDGTWHQISPKYVIAEVLLRIILLAVIAVAAYAATTLLAQPWPWAWTVAGAIAVVILFELVILPRQARAIGYMLRADDIVFRRGILWQRMIAVPYGRMQLVDITRGPVDRAFGIAKLKLVTAAATTGVEIPGMTEDAAESLRDTLIDVAEMRRTGL
ncbi:PH domain-containing protein [Microbacterium sp. NPDC056052]|uniref:PH domain-containing protein n=1 Tax=Microbacterium sp. NPDC056052 TaxID=3345695 RepID=UPI0035DF5FA6